MPKIVCVVPTIRPERMSSFKESWAPLFEKHGVILVTVYDGKDPVIQAEGKGYEDFPDRYSAFNAKSNQDIGAENLDLFYQFTDSVRNLGFVYAARLKPDYVLTLDDDVEPLPKAGFAGTDADERYRLAVEDNDPIRDHLRLLDQRVSTSWVPTFVGFGDDGSVHTPRGFPDCVKAESPVMLSHGVWSGVLDYDGATQVKLEDEGSSLGNAAYFRGPVPKGILFPMCGMNVMVKAEALPYLYFAPMGVGTKLPLHRFGDIWCGVFLKREFDARGWACYTGGSVVHHTRASDARKNAEQERLGREWNEWLWRDTERGRYPQSIGGVYNDYLASYADKRKRYKTLIEGILS